MPALCTDCSTDVLIKVRLDHVQAQGLFRISIPGVRQLLLSDKDGHEVDVELKHVAEHFWFKVELVTYQSF